MRNLSQLIAASAVIPLCLAAAAPASAASAASPASAASTVTSPAGGGYAPISGSGSLYAAVPIFQWSADVSPKGITVNFNADGSAEGQQDYAANQDDFAASDLAFRSAPDKLAGLGAQHISQGYSYVPGAAVGIAFTYHLSVHGHLIRNLRLTPGLLFDIFTGKITNWDDPQITRVYGTQLPNLPIIPVVNSQPAGTTYFFTRWLATLFTSQWNAFCDLVHPGITPPCGPTEVYPQFGKVKAEDGSENIDAYIASAAANGAIGYAEYPYALAGHEAVLKLLNPAGDYVRPTPADVTTALTRVLINEDPDSPNYLQQDLNRVYVFKNPRSYPLSSYSYLIVPRTGTQLPASFTGADGRTLSAFIDFALCRAQSQLTRIGYPALPANLIAGGLLEVKNIPGHVRVPTPAQCR